MSARDAILSRIRAALAEEPETGPAPDSVLWPPGTWEQPPDLAQRFFEELQRVQGEGRRCASLDEARQAVEELVQQLGASSVAVVDHPLSRAATAGLTTAKVVPIDAGWDRHDLAGLPFAVLPAEFLLADTGTAVLLPRSSAERLLCYLPTVQVLVAPGAGLFAHLSDVWDQLSARADDPTARGEMLLVTGPSRTADIEKKLVLGAHGPKRLIVLLVEDDFSRPQVQQPG
jgi:L-lactate dehydrogenase complex protein LldG